MKISITAILILLTLSLLGQVENQNLKTTQITSTMKTLKLSTLALLLSTMTFAQWTQYAPNPVNDPANAAEQVLHPTNHALLLYGLKQWLINNLWVFFISCRYGFFNAPASSLKS